MKVTGRLSNTYQTSLNIDGFDYKADRPILDGGNDSAASPLGLLIGSLAACKLMVAKGYLDHNHIAYDDVNAETESVLRGKSRNETIAVLVEIQVTGAQMDAKEINYMARIVEKGCTVANILTAGGRNEVRTVIEVG